MDKLTPQQRQMLQTWTEQRDSLLADIRVYSIQLEDLQKSTKEQGQNLAALHVSIGEARGHIAELDALETRMRGSIATDIAELEIRKTRLESECTALGEKVKTGNENFAICSSAITELESAHAIMKDQAAIVDRVVGEIIQTSTLHTSEMKTIMTEIRTISAEVIEKSNETLAHSSELIKTVPVFVERLQKSISARRKYPKGHPNFVETE